MMKELWISIWSGLVSMSTLAEVEDIVDKELGISFMENLQLSKYESYVYVYMDEKYVPRLQEIINEYSGFKVMSDEE